ncbi:hypothetical protein IFT68_08860 [Oxalobacteraceae sp. CFBP 13730]|nr:hypothetical protein [Oxalobacteraceae sp. CFBP 13730]
MQLMAYQQYPCQVDVNIVNTKFLKIKSIGIFAERKLAASLPGRITVSRHRPPFVLTNVTSENAMGDPWRARTLFVAT